eukprot:scaffold726_cov262-Pinguiococcus_pyrenoidosus.AAC.2
MQPARNRNQKQIPSSFWKTHLLRELPTAERSSILEMAFSARMTSRGNWRIPLRLRCRPKRPLRQRRHGRHVSMV